MTGRSRESIGSYLGRINWHAVKLLAVVSAIEGASFPLVKIAVSGGIPPATLTTGRSLLAVFALFAFAAAGRDKPPLRKLLAWRLAPVAAFGFAIPYVLISWSQYHISSSNAVILFATVPLLTVILAGFWRPGRAVANPLTGAARTAAFLAPGLLGVVVLVGPTAMFSHQAEFMASLANVAAAVAAAAGVVTLGRLAPLPGITVGTSLCGFAGLTVLPVALVVDRPWVLSPSPEAIVAMILLGLVSSAVMTVVYFQLISTAGATFAALRSYLAPVSGLGLSALLLGERIGAIEIASILLILTSIFLLASPLEARRAQQSHGRRGRAAATPWDGRSLRTAEAAAGCGNPISRPDQPERPDAIAPGRPRLAADSAWRLAAGRRLVVKVGSALLVDEESGTIRRAWLDALVADIVRCRARGQEVLIVSSGAVAVGWRHFGIPGQPKRMERKQAVAATGQVRLAHAYQEALDRYGVTVAQVLLTPEDTEERRRHLNARATLNELLTLDAVPVINENDTVTTDEIRFGDNDRLAARIAQMVSADTLVLLSDIDGLYTADPRKHADAVLVPEVRELTAEIEAMAGGAPVGYSSGGMVTKLAAARIAMSAGCRMVIAKGCPARPLSAIEQGAPTTWFLPSAEPQTARKAWIASALQPTGSLVVDDGAAGAILRGKSLLPVGVVGVEGAFDRGASVMIRDRDGIELARGLCAYSSDEALVIAGHKSVEIERLLGYRRRDEIVARDDLALTGCRPSNVIELRSRPRNRERPGPGPVREAE